MRYSRISVDSDLTEAALESVMKRLPRATHLVVSSIELDVGKRLAGNLMLELDPDLPKYAWYVYQNDAGIFSPGA